MLENEDNTPLSVIRLVSLVKIRSRKLWTLFSILVGWSISCVKSSEPVASFSLVSKGEMPLWARVVCVMNTLPAFMSPATIMAEGEKVYAVLTLSVSLSMIVLVCHELGVEVNMCYRR